MQKRTLKVALLAVLAIVLVLGFSRVALADQTWSDLPDTVTAKYGVTDNQVAAISEGFTERSLETLPERHPRPVHQDGCGGFRYPVWRIRPPRPSRTSPKAAIYYPYIEGAKAAGLVNGATATTFGPNDDHHPSAGHRHRRPLASPRPTATTWPPCTRPPRSTGLLAHFGDRPASPPICRDEVAFAYDLGITKGDDYGNLAPAANLTRIQGAAFLIRAQAKVPPAQWTAAKIELVTADKTENLIGQTATVTFKVTDAAGHPAVGVLVDFDTLTGGPFYVGNISQQAAVTNNFGQVTVNLISTEPGTQRVSAPS